jgi:very-short-patch-repair endonuclease
MRQEDLFRQRFNVAASRAKDQLWVIHSLDPRTDLQPGDLRRRLIHHAEQPSALLNEQLSMTRRVESEFERLVVERLIRAQYMVHPQYPVGHYRIDLVVEGRNGRRLAVECDGDRFHPIDQIADDMARQAVLERIGWKFVRIRGSHFFRDPDAAMTTVFEKLAQLEIEPLGQTDPNSSAQPDDELVSKLKSRAAEIMSTWKQDEES